MQVHTGPGEEARREWDQPDQTQQYRNAGNDLGVDPAGLGPRINLGERGEIVADDAGDNLYQKA